MSRTLYQRIVGAHLGSRHRGARPRGALDIDLAVHNHRNHHRATGSGGDLIRPTRIY